MTPIETHLLSKEIRGRPILREVTLTAEEGEVFGLLGPNGAGKTTTLRILAGLLRPSAGWARIAGQEVKPDRPMPPESRRRVGLLTEQPGFYARLSALDNLVHFGRLYGLTAREAESRSRILSERLGLSAHLHRPFAALSRGMKQKLALARAVAHRPAVLLLDEPTVGLDPEATREVRGMIRDLADAGTTIVLCTHQLDEVQRLCKRAAVLSTTLISIHDLTRPQEGVHSVRIRLESFEDQFVAVAASQRGISVVSHDGPELTIQTSHPSDTPGVVEALVSSGARIQAVEPQRSHLEESYLRILEQSRREEPSP